MATYRTAPVGARDPLIPLTTAYALTGSGYPGRMLIESEIAYVVGGAGTSTIFVLRGQDGTDAASHPATAISDLNVPAAAPSFDEAAHDEHDHSEVPGLPEGGASTAAEVSYDPTVSGLTAEDVQAALDEVAAAPGGTPTLAEVLAEGNDTGGTADILTPAFVSVRGSIELAANVSATATATGAGTDAAADRIATSAEGDAHANTTATVAGVQDANARTTATTVGGNADVSRSAEVSDVGGGDAVADTSATTVDSEAHANTSVSASGDGDATILLSATVEGTGLATASVMASRAASEAGMRIEVDATSARVGFNGATPVARPEVPATPTEQDIVDALVALGLITQAAP